MLHRFTINCIINFSKKMQFSIFLKNFLKEKLQSFYFDECSSFYDALNPLSSTQKSITLNYSSLFMSFFASIFLFALHPVSTLYIYIIVFAPRNFAKLILCKIKLYVLLVFTFFKGTLSTFQKNLSQLFLRNFPL